MKTKASKHGTSICGVGAVTGYGWGRKLLWEGVTSERPAAQPVPEMAEFLPGDEAWVAVIPDGGDPTDGPSRFARALRASVREAVEDAVDRGWRPGETVGVIHAVVLGEVEQWQSFFVGAQRGRMHRRFLQLMPSLPLTGIMQEFGFHGPCMNVTAMCAGGNVALITAKQWIDTGIADDVLVVATDVSGTPETIAAFVNLGVMVADSHPFDACRPFQEGSRGFVGGEASVAMMVSGRPDGSYATLLGGAMSHDAHHVVSIEPSHEHIRRCVRSALDLAEVDGVDVVYLNAHGPGTKQCDAAEAEVLDELLPNAVGVYSFKPLVGHCQSATAAVEVALSCLAYETGAIPAPPVVAAGHPKLVDGLTPRVAGPVLKSSIGMGGHNSAIVLDEPVQ